MTNSELLRQIKILFKILVNGLFFVQYQNITLKHKEMKTIFVLKWFFVLSMSLGISTLYSCKKDQTPNSLPNEIIGSWVEINTLADTIFFSSNDAKGLFSLHRGYEIRNGYRLPVIGSTMYLYELARDSIKLVDGLSSSMDGGTYYFHFNASDLTFNIGKFSKYINTDKSTLTFRKFN